MEEKLEKLPEENRTHLSIQDWVHFDGREKDNSDSSSQEDIEQLKQKIRKEVKKELEEQYNARLEREAEARVKIQLKQQKTTKQAKPMTPRYNQQSPQVPVMTIPVES